MAKRYLEGAYARLVGLEKATVLAEHIVAYSYASDYEKILEGLRQNVDDKFEDFDLPSDGRWPRSDDVEYKKDVLRSKILQLIEYLKLMYSASDQIAEIGSVFATIRDNTLRARCGDLLAADEHFERVINQATLVLEERLKSMLPELADSFGLTLVGKAINAEPNKSRIQFSMNAAEQEGFAALFKGLVGAFRNPSHHRFLADVTREQALQICAFIDNMLAALHIARVQEPISTSN